MKYLLFSLFLAAASLWMGCGSGASDSAYSPQVCVSEDTFRCDSGNVYWFDSCGDAQGVKEDCGGEGCSGTQCGLDCAPRDSARCDSGHVYWFDRCGNREGVKETCDALGCSSALCRSSATYGTDFSNTVSQWRVPTLQGASGHGVYATSNRQVSFRDNERWEIMDLNGDGRPDLVSPSKYTDTSEVYGYGTTATHWRVWLNTGDRFSSTSAQWKVPTLQGASGHGVYATSNSQVSFRDNERWEIMDLNGDGRPDLVSPSKYTDTAEVYGYGTAATHWRVWLNTGDRFASASTQWKVPTLQGASGHGVHVTSNSQVSFRDNERWETMDLNGDGRPDLVSPSKYTDTVEVYGYGTAATHWRVWLNTGNRFSSMPAQWSVPTLQGASGHGVYATSNSQASFRDNERWEIMDLNGDGRPDLVSPSKYTDTAEVYGYGTMETYWRVWLNTDD